MNDSGTTSTHRQFLAEELHQRLLAEAVRVYEDARGRPLDEADALDKARAAGGDLEQRIILRSQSLSVAPALITALRQLRGASTLVVIALVVAALLAGATTAQVALGSTVEEYVNFFWVLGGLLAVPTMALLLWLVLISLRPADVATGFLGALALGLGRRLDQWLHRGAEQAAAVQASAELLTRGAIGRWTLSAISHALWLAFLVACLAMVLLTLSTRQYSFAWETTILSQPVFVTLTRALAFVPDTLGFATPNARQIAASQWTGEGQPTSAGADAWAGLLVGSILVYGVLPRALLLLLCLAARVRAKKRFRLNTALSGYARLQADLMPLARSLGVVDAERLPQQVIGSASSSEDHALRIGPDGPTAILGLEIAPPEAGWPPYLNGSDWLDLGFVDNRTDRHRVIDGLAAAATPPRLILIVCSLAATPDRGIRSFIHKLQTAIRAPVAIVLTEGQRLRHRGDTEQVALRVEDWRRLASNAQVPTERILEVDLDHLTVASRGRLAAFLGASTAVENRERRLAQAFELIVARVQNWKAQPDLAAQAELQRALAKLYQGETPAWQRLLQTGSTTASDQVAQVRSSADRMLNLLPERLKARPRWLAAGALAGALGCVAAATLSAPAAIVALPVWAGFGAAVSAALQIAGADTSAPDRPETDVTDAVNAAALFALVLELQGRDEASISRILDQVVGADEPPLIDGADAARAWLERLRRRLDQTLAGEGVA